jgi:hypothetical protein
VEIASPVGIASMTNSDDVDQPAIVVDGIHDPVVTDPESPQIRRAS